MTIDERLERLTDRHEALTQSVEMHEKRFEEIGENIRGLAAIAEQNEVRAGEMQTAMTRMMDSITRLARIAGSHEEPIGSLES
jgi:transcription termination factor Rho